MMRRGVCISPSDRVTAESERELMQVASSRIPPPFARLSGRTTGKLGNLQHLTALGFCRGKVGWRQLFFWKFSLTSVIRADSIFARDQSSSMSVAILATLRCSLQGD